MLTIQPIRDQLSRRVQLINDPVSVLLDTCREDDNLIILGHFLQKLRAIRPDQKVGLPATPIVYVVDQRFI